MQVSESITRRSASNLALAFALLPREKRAAMVALYAFCREVDDVADDESVPTAERRERLAFWRRDVKAACDGGAPELAVNRELQPCIARYGLPFGLFDELVRGVEMDLDIQRYATWEELDLYCYRVASVVGLLSVEVFEYRNAACRDYAVHLGRALQLTNILRDVGNDAARARIYLPLAEMARFGVTEAEILRGERSERFEALARSVAARAREFYRLAADALPPEDRRSLATAELMGAVYWRVLRKIELGGFDVLGPKPTRLGRVQKLLLVVRAAFRAAVGSSAPAYGGA